MIHKDFLAEKLKMFAQACTRPLVEAHLRGDLSSLPEVENAIGELLEMNPSVCMQLAPASLTTMMSLQGIGNAVSQEVAYVFRQEAKVYQKAGNAALSAQRLAQAEAIERAFSCDGTQCPKEFAEFEQKIC